MAYGTIEYKKAATATFENTARELIDITVKKEWKTQDGTTDIPQADLPKAIYLQLQRTETPDEADSWLPVSGYESVELKNPTVTKAGPNSLPGWTSTMRTRRGMTMSLTPTACWNARRQMGNFTAARMAM